MNGSLLLPVFNPDPTPGSTGPKWNIPIPISLHTEVMCRKTTGDLVWPRTWAQQNHSSTHSKLTEHLHNRESDARATISLLWL